MNAPIYKLNSAKKEYLSQLKIYNTLIANLKTVFFERKVWRDETSPLIIKSEIDMMKMTYAYLIGRCPRNRWDLSVNKPNSNYYTIYDDNYKEWNGGTPPIYIVKMEHLKEIHNEHLRKTWKRMVEADKCISGYEQWKNKITNAELAIEMNDLFPNFHIINEPKLKIKNIIVIFPK